MFYFEKNRWKRRSPIFFVFFPTKKQNRVSSFSSKEDMPKTCISKRTWRNNEREAELSAFKTPKRKGGRGRFAIQWIDTKWVHHYNSSVQFWVYIPGNEFQHYVAGGEYGMPGIELTKTMYKGSLDDGD